MYCPLELQRRLTSSLSLTVEASSGNRLRISVRWVSHSILALTLSLLSCQIPFPANHIFSSWHKKSEDFQKLLSNQTCIKISAFPATSQVTSVDSGKPGPCSPTKSLPASSCKNNYRRTSSCDCAVKTTAARPSLPAESSR